MSTALMADDLRHQTTPYSDRAIPATETVRNLEQHFPALGITRVARQTGLDRIGIPCFAAFRPNASTLSNSQGKGLDDDAARASAVMEAAEFAIAEKPVIPMEAATIAELRASGFRVFDARRLLPIGQGTPEDRPLAFVRGLDLLRGTTVMVPHEAVTLDPTGAKLHHLNRSTNGLASGNNEQEAVFHSLCELVERDATTLYRARKGTSRPIDLASIQSQVVRELIAQIRDAGFDLWLLDQTSDLRIPTFQAVIGDPALDYSRHFDLATGYGCHPVTDRALIRAITEAAQTRVTNIAGSRDDFVPDEYNMGLHRSLIDGLRGGTEGPVPLPEGCALGTPLSAMLNLVLDRLEARGVTEVTMVRMGGAQYGISVVRVFAPDLEDKAANRNWRPGKRYLRAMMAAQ
jgi:ribosomal protein S12 methylthiotransferase accessory factor